MRLMRLAVACLVLNLAACAGGDESGFLVPLGSDAGVGRTITLFSATSRGADEETKPGTMFGGTRATGSSFVSFSISVPPERKAGELPIDARKLDPQKNFVLVSSHRHSQPEFMQKVREAVLSRPVKDRRVLVFTHGFNTRFDEAVFRFAQIVEDTGFKGVPVLFSWPSRGSSTEYGYDRDSAVYSRDQFEGVLTELGKEKAISGIDIFAHSMGNWLTLETLRQASIANNTVAIGKIQRVVLAAPDVDMDVFRTQVRRMGHLASRFVLYASQDDKALRLSSFLFGGQMRAGENTDLEDFRRLGIEAHDLSGVPGGFGRNHGKAFNDADTVRGIGGVLEQPGPVEHAGNLLNHGVQAVGRLTQTLTPRSR